MSKLFSSKMKKYLVALPLLGILFYFPSLFYNFSQDDFIHAFASQANNLIDFLNFFNPSKNFSDIFFYRPLSTQVHFFLLTKIFGLSALPFHIISLVFHILNSYLFYLIIKKIWRDKHIALLSSFFYAISAVHFLSLFYISSFQEIARTLYILLSIFLFIKYFETNKTALYIGSLLSFIAALLSKETSIILPLLIPLVEVLRRKDENVLKVLESIILPLTAYFGILISYIVIRSIGFLTIFNQGSYNISFSFFDIFQNLKWYIIWSFGLPEVLSTYPNLRINSLLLFSKDFYFGGLILILGLIFVLTLVIIIIRNFKKNTETKSLKILVSCFLIFLISLLPVLFLHQHKYPQYLDIAFLGLLPVIAYLILSKRKKILIAICILSFSLLQFLSIKLSENSHWSTKRSNLVSYYQQKFFTQYPDISADSKIILIGQRQALKEVSFAFAQKYAFLVWYPRKVQSVSYIVPSEINNIKDGIRMWLDKY